MEYALGQSVTLDRAEAGRIVGRTLGRQRYNVDVGGRIHADVEAERLRPRAAIEVVGLDLADANACIARHEARVKQGGRR